MGDRHPDPVVETSSLASVELPDITYQLTIPNEKIELNTLSALQLETIVYASQRHNTFLPDGYKSWISYWYFILKKRNFIYLNLF